jgi:hypothetical protein
MKKIILGLAIVLVLSFCVGGIVSASTMYSGITTRSGVPLYEVMSGTGATSSGCTDTDGGKDAYIRGTACIGGSCKTDGCYSQDKLREYYCGWGKVGYGYPQTETAEVILETGTVCRYGCENGVCLRMARFSYTEGLGTEHSVGLECIPDNGILQTFASVKGECCAGLHEIASGYRNGVTYCTSEVCGNGQCQAKENEWNCSEDCEVTTGDTGVDVQSIKDMLEQFQVKFLEMLNMLESIIAACSTT